MKLVVVALCVPLLTHPQTATTGACSPAVSNVSGNVTITFEARSCPGLSPATVKLLNEFVRTHPKVLSRLTELLDLKDKQLGEAKAGLLDRDRQVEEWIEKYKALESAVAQQTGSDVRSKAQVALAEGRLDEAGELLDSMLRDAGEKVAKIASLYFDRARVFELQFKPQEAISHYEKAVIFAPQNSDYYFAYARCLSSLGQHEKALVVYEALEKGIASKGALTPVLLGNILALQQAQAQSLTRSGKYQDAKAKYVGALRTLEALTRSTSDRLSWRIAKVEILSCLAGLEADENDYEAAEKHLSEAVTEREVGVERLVALVELARLQSLRGKKEQALMSYSEAKRSIPQLLGSFDRADINLELGRLHHRMGNLREAEEALGLALQLGRSSGRTDPEMKEWTVQVLASLGSVLAEGDLTDKAEKVYLEAISLLESPGATNAQDSTLGVVLGNLGNLYADMNRYDEAASFLLRALKVFDGLAARTPDVYESDLANLNNSLGTVYLALRRYSEAKTALENSLGVRERLFERNPSVYAMSLGSTYHNLALVQASFRLTGEAESSFARALSLYRRNSQGDLYPPHVVRLFMQRAEYRHVVGDDQRAVIDYVEALEGYRALLAKGGERFRRPLNEALLGVAATHRRLGNNEAACAAVSQLPSLPADDDLRSFAESCRK